MRTSVRGKTFDSHLAGDVLTLILHVVLVPARAGQVRPSAFTAPAPPPKAWPSALWAAWPAQWKQLMLDAWHDQFELHSAGAHLRTPESRRLKCHLDLHVQGVDDTFRAPAHLKALVEFHGRNAFMQSSAYRGGLDQQNRVDMVMDYRDVHAARKGGGINQHGATHEFGHHLGLAHRCHKIGNGYCGGVSGVDRSDIMASGDTAKPWHAEPWMRRLRHHDYHPTENWWAVVVGGSVRSGEVQPSAQSDSRDVWVASQDQMKETAGLDRADVDSLIAPPPARAGAAPRRRGFLAAIRAALGLPQR